MPTFLRVWVLAVNDNTFFPSTFDFENYRVFQDPKCGICPQDEVRKRVWVFSSDFYEGNMASIYWGIPDNIEKTLSRNSLLGQWLGLHAFTARDLVRNPSPGSKILQTALAPKQKQTKRCLPRERFAKATYIYAILHVWLESKGSDASADSHSFEERCYPFSIFIICGFLITWHQNR